MLTKLTIRNFKRFDDVEIELGNPVVFIGPNNSGKTTALQALSLWNTGLKRWNEKRSGEKPPEKRSGVALNRRDLVAVPVPDASLLWRDLHVRESLKKNGKQQTQNIRIDITVEGVTNGTAWECGLEFDYANEESLYCRPLRFSEAKNGDRMPIPSEASLLNVAFLPPMSGLAESETRLDPGAINVRLGEGRTAEVLRNLCYKILSEESGSAQWDQVCQTIESLFGVKLHEPRYVPERGEITMGYQDPSGTRLDLSCAGRGLQQTLLLLAHLAANPHSVILVDEPDAHLEILRQRQIYDLMAKLAGEQESQVIAASHSEVVLNEAAGRDTVIAFVGSRPHRIDNRGHHVLKSLKDIGFDQFYQAEQVGWVLYLEGSTDLSILRAFAETLKHPATTALERPFVHYVANQPSAARNHFFGLQEAKHDLVGIAVFDKLEKELQSTEALAEIAWSKREIENYLCTRKVLLAWAEKFSRTDGGGPLFTPEWVTAMEESIADIETAMRKLDKGSPWSNDTKVTDDFLNPLFKAFFERLGLPNLFQKTDYHVLASLVAPEDVDEEVIAALDRIHEVSSRASFVR
ncbi:MAG: AAA family ATPase [Pirellulales bacterium]|nr:AAA family ATPase [Pirellulales bacterium]